MGTVTTGASDVASWYVDPDRPCAQTPEAWWFPAPRASRTTTAQVAALCVQCPVRAQCADDARTCDDRYGIRAGVDLGHVAEPDRSLVLAQIAGSPAPDCEPIAVGRKGFRRAPAELIHLPRAGVTHRVQAGRVSAAPRVMTLR